MGKRGRAVEVLAIALTLAGLAVAISLAAASDGVYQDDDICHYLYARDSWHSRDALLDWWAKPGYNIPTMLVAHLFGVPGCRVFSALMTAGTAYLAYRIARRTLGCTPAAALAPALVWVQPLVMTLACTTLTETPAALYLSLGVWLLMRGNRIWACTAFSLLFVTRFEAMVLAPIPAAAIVCEALRRKQWRIGPAMRTGWLWACAGAMVWAPVLYIVVTGVAEVSKEASVLHMLSRQYVQTYGKGAWHHYIAIWPEAIGVGALSLTVAGAVSAGRRAALVSAMTFGLVAVHAVLFANGLFASGGYSRFLVPVSGLAGALAACGLRAAWRGQGRLSSAAVFATVAAALYLLDRDFPSIFQGRQVTMPIVIVLAFWAALGLATTMLNRPRPRAIMGRFAAAFAVLLAVAQAIGQVGPLRLARDPVRAVIAQAVEVTRQAPYVDRMVISQHVLTRFLREDAVRAWTNLDAVDKWRATGAGTLFLWENKDCFKARAMESTRLLHDEMFRLGRLVCRKESRRAIAEVFERLPGAQTRPAGTVPPTPIWSPSE